MKADKENKKNSGEIPPNMEGNKSNKLLPFLKFVQEKELGVITILKNENGDFKLKFSIIGSQLCKEKIIHLLGSYNIINEDKEIESQSELNSLTNF
jgi:hypothetical protein